MARFIGRWSRINDLDLKAAAGPEEPRLCALGRSSQPSMVVGQVLISPISTAKSPAAAPQMTRRIGMAGSALRRSGESRPRTRVGLVAARSIPVPTHTRPIHREEPARAEHHDHGNSSRLTHQAPPSIVGLLLGRLRDGGGDGQDSAISATTVRIQWPRSHWLLRRSSCRNGCSVPELTRRRWTRTSQATEPNRTIRKQAAASSADARGVSSAPRAKPIVETRDARLPSGAPQHPARAGLHRARAMRIDAQCPRRHLGAAGR
jgi:hypothetical protein